MNTDDFRYMRRGIPLEVLPPESADVLAPIDKRGQNNERALLLLHGFSSSPAVYRNFIPTLSNYDAIVSPLLPGHGESLSVFSTTKAQEWIKAVEEMCASLCATYQKVDVLGLSLGGTIACDLSTKFPLNHLYLLAPALDLRCSLNFTLYNAHILYALGFRRVRNRAGNLLTDNFSELAYRQLPLATIIELLNYIKNYKFVTPSCPTDLFLGEFDIVVDCKKIAQRFASAPNVTIHWLSNSAHVLPLDGDVDEIVKCIRDNLER
jgi:carboxylesterase